MELKPLGRLSKPMRYSALCYVLLPQFLDVSRLSLFGLAVKDNLKGLSWEHV